VRLFGEEIAVQGPYPYPGFSAHPTQKGYSIGWSHLRNPRLEIFVNHGKRRSRGAESAHPRAVPFQNDCAPMEEKRILFSEVEKGIPEREVEEETTPEEPLSVLLNRLDSNL